MKNKTKQNKKIPLIIEDVLLFELKEKKSSAVEEARELNEKKSSGVGDFFIVEIFLFG